MMTNATARERYRVLAEGIGDLYEQYGELYAEYRGEIARFGDAWPGAALDVAAMSDAIRGVERELVYLADLLGRGPIVDEPQPPRPPDPEEPF